MAYAIEAPSSDDSSASSSAATTVNRKHLNQSDLITNESDAIMVLEELKRSKGPTASSLINYGSKRQHKITPQINPTAACSARTRPYYRKYKKTNISLTKPRIAEKIR
jgi:hypothetical protein